MKKFALASIGLFLAVVLVGGCGPAGSSRGPDKSAKKGGEEHEHGPGPHGGTIFDFGKWHCEFNVDHKTQEVTIYVCSVSGNQPVAIQVEKPLLSIKNPQFQVELKAVPQEGDPAGKSSRFVAKHENFGMEQEFEGTMSGVVEGKPYAGDFKEEEHKDHKHEKK
jgi:hypothetical protein